jgi:hypothetical protein
MILLDNFGHWLTAISDRSYVHIAVLILSMSNKYQSSAGAGFGCMACALNPGTKDFCCCVQVSRLREN